MKTPDSQAPSGEGVIERLEAASEGSWVLDNAIREAIGHGYRDSYAYTTSLDAALTLVPEGWDWSVGVCYRDHLDKPLIFAHCADVRNGIESARKGASHVEGVAATAPLALCLAALAARQTSQGEKP